MSEENRVAPAPPDHSGGFDMNQIGRDVREMGAQLDSLNGKIVLTDRSIRELPCQKSGVCPPAQRTTAEMPREVGYVDDDGTQVITASDVVPHVQRESQMDNRDRRLREANEDELADELLERRGRRQRRRQLLEEDITVGLDLRGALPRTPSIISTPVNPVANVKDEIKHGLDELMANRPKWYKNPFFHTTWGFVIVLIIYFSFDYIVGFLGYSSAGAMLDGNPQTLPYEENAPADDEVRDVTFNVEGINNSISSAYNQRLRDLASAYNTNLTGVRGIFEQMRAKILEARNRVNAVIHTAGASRLYEAELEYLNEALRLLDEASGMSVGIIETKPEKLGKE